MGLFQRLLSWFNPTSVWEEDLAQSRIVDLDQHSFCGVAAGELVEGLSFLGPAKVTHLGFAWPYKGIDVTVSDSRIVEMGFYFGHPIEAEKGAFAGSFRYCDVPLKLSKQLHEAELQALFGRPYWRDQDDDEIILFYEFPNCEWQLELDLDGSLKALVIGKQQLADSSQRKAYGVSKPWPPEYL